MPPSQIVSPTSDGKWQSKPIGHAGPTTSHKTQAEAVATAKQQLTQAGGGELTVQGKDGKIVDKITVKPGNDPFPPKDKK